MASPEMVMVPESFESSLQAAKDRAIAAASIIMDILFIFSVFVIFSQFSDSHRIPF